MSRIKIIAVMAVLLAMLLLIPTAFASENQTAFELSDNADEAIASDSYFDAGIANDTGNGTKDNPFKELTIDRINDNSVIHLEDGQYYVNGYIDKYNLTFIGKSSQNTVISYADFSTYSSLTFKNLTLKSSTINVYGKLSAQNVIFSDSYNNNGGVIYSASDYSRIDIQNSTFENNNAQYGGAIYISGNGVLNVQDSIFKDNYAYHFGGAITAENNANITIKKSKFINDYSTADVGGAIYIRDSDRFIGENLEFVNCSATFGGAIIALNSNVTLTSINAYNNRAKYNGGAFYSMYGYITVKNSIFDNNSAENGGALFVDGAEIFNVYSNRFTNNIAQETAGGLYCFFSDIFYDSIFDEALNNSFSKNKAKNFSDAYKSDIIDIIIASGNYDLIQIESSTFNGTLPSKYDLRDYNQVTPVKNQGAGGNCWSFSSLAALESCILKATGKSYDLSEGNMKNIMSLFSDYGWGMAPNVGGYDDMGVGYLTSWLGPVYESEDAYYEKSVISPLLDSLIHVQNILFLSRSDYTDNDAIKKAIMDYGAVSSCIYWEGTYLKDRINYYNNGTSGSNHAVAIVGWDDNYPASKFNIAPPGDGAWIIKNSWGTGSGNKGFYYVSYYDMKLATVNKSDVSFTFILNDTVRYDKNYQYDLPGRTDYFFNSSSTVWYKNKYRATANEYLAAVSTYFEKETSWNLSVYVNSVLKHVQSGKSPSSYSTIELSKMIPLKIGDFFEIEFEISVKGDAGVPISEAVSLNHKFYTENISYISYDGVKWADLYELAWVYPGHTYSSQVACIKAFTIVNADDDSQDIEKLEQSINAEYLETYLNENYRFTVKILDKSGNALVDKKVSFSLNGETFSANTNRQGIAVLDYAFDKAGKYKISVSSPAQDNYMDSKSTIYFTVNKVNISENDMNVIDQGNGTVVVVLPENATGNVTITVAGKNFTGEVINGTAVITLENAIPGTHEVDVIYSGDGKYTNATTKSEVTIPKFETPIKVDVEDIKVEDTALIIVTLPKKATGSVTIKINGKEYEPVKYVNGVARFEVDDLAFGDKTVTVKFAGDDIFLENSTTAYFTVFKYDSQVNVTVDASDVGSDVTINVTIPEDATGYVIVNVDGTDYAVNTTDGIGSLVIPGVGNETHAVKVTYIGDDKYLSSKNETEYGLNKVNSTVEVIAKDIAVVDVATVDITVTTNATGNVTVKIGDEFEQTVGVVDGVISVVVPGLTVGDKTVEVTYNGDDKYLPSKDTAEFTVKSTIKLPSNAVYTLNSKYNVNLYDKNGTAINGKVTISIGANMYYLTCKDGLASLVLDLAPASYSVSITNPQTNESLTQTIKVVKRITMNKDLTMYYGAGSSYKVKVVNDYGKIQKNLKVTFKVNGRTYYAYTDSKGYASLKISLLPKTYKITATYKGFTVSNKITVKKTIITYDKKVKKGKTIKFTAKLLSSKGKILKYKKVTFKFKGKTYKVKTNSKGIATLKITKKYKVGKYTITTKYGSAKVSNKIKIVK